MLTWFTRFLYQCRPTREILWLMLKTEVMFEEEVKNHGDKKVLDEQDTVHHDHQSGLVEVLHTVLQKIKFLLER
jgi:hypothetical protein